MNKNELLKQINEKIIQLQWRIDDVVKGMKENHDHDYIVYCMATEYAYSRSLRMLKALKRSINKLDEKGVK